MRGRRLGVRWSRPGLGAQLREVARAGIGVQPAPPNISILMGTDSGSKRTKHQVLVQGQVMYNSGTDGGAVRAVIRALGALSDAVPAGAVTVRAFLLIDRDGDATLVDRRLAPDFELIAPSLRRSGHRVVDVPHLHVRPEDAVAVLPDGAAAANASIEVIDERWPAQGSDDPLISGEVALSRLVYRGRPEPESRAVALADLVPLVRDPSGRVRAVEVEALRELVTRCELGAMLGRDRQQLRRALGLA